MGRYIGSVCKLCRREGVKLFIKGTRCHGGKCSLDRRSSPPGMHTWRRGKLSEYGKRLREKQKAKRYYGIFDTQFKNYFLKAQKQKGSVGKNLLILLERRLDNVVFRGGLAHSRPHARQIVMHGHILVNGKRVDIPSYLVKEGDMIQVGSGETSQKFIKKLVESTASFQPPSWLERIDDPLSIKVIQLPVREEIQIDLQEQLIVEFFSR